MQSTVGVVASAPLSYYKLDDAREKDPRAIYAEWNQRLDNLNKSMTWQTLDSSVTPVDLNMGFTFSFTSLCAAFERNASKERTKVEVLTSFTYDFEARKCITDQGTMRFKNRLGWPLNM
jgi:hypothetical protein